MIRSLELDLGGRPVGRSGNHSRSPMLMGILNVTPDSFSDGGQHAAPAAAIAHGIRLVEDGAQWLDVGGESTRPGAQPVDAAEELRRVRPVLEGLRSRVQVPISIDTTKASVARVGLDLGCDAINDVSGLRFDPEMIPLVAASRCGLILMHMQGEPRTMQQAPTYDDVVGEVGGWLRDRLAELVGRGIAANRIILDPGIGFGKSFEANMALLQNLDRVRAAGRPLLVGTSRKTFLGKLLQEPEPERRLEGDLAVAAWCRAASVDMLRVHDVRAVRRFLTVLDALDAPPDATT